jgi:dTDP-glucose 4,6-dehydratase
MDRILITGAAGFIGSNLARYILENTDWDVVSLDRLDEAGTLERLTALKQAQPARLQCVWHDLKSAINPAHRSHKPLREPFKYVAHLAAMSHVDRAIRDPIGAIYDNVLGTGHLLEYVRHHQPDSKCLIFSTDEVFGPARPGESFDEYARFNAENAYAATKAGAEALAPAYVHQYGCRIVVSRCANVYGPGQYQEKFIPLCIEKIQRGQLVQIHARDGVSSSRLYIHTDDVSSAVLTILEKGGIIADDRSGRYNISTGVEWSNLEVADKIAELLCLPLKFELVEKPAGRPKPDMRYDIDASRLRALGWAPTVSLDDGLRSVVLGDELEQALGCDAVA